MNMKTNLYKRITYLAMACLALACNSSISPEVPVTPVEKPESSETVPSVRTIVLSAESDGSDTKTSLSGSSIVWSEGDELRVMSLSAGNTITGTLTGTSQGYGVKVSKSSGSAKVRYGGIRIVSTANNGKTVDITAARTAQGTVNNSYGIYSSAGYTYSPAGTVIDAEINSSGTIPLIQSSSGASEISKNSTITVTLSNVEYSLDGGSSWTMVGSGDQLVNGFGGKGKLSNVSATFDGADYLFSLRSGAGTTHAELSCTTASDADPSVGTVAVYPASSLTGTGSGNLQVYLPEVQSYAEDSFGNGSFLAVGQVVANADGSYSASMKNMCGVIRLSLTGSCTLSKITLTDRGGSSLWGSASVPVSSYGDGVSTAMLSGGSNVLTLDCSGVQLTSEAHNFHFVLPVGALNKGMTVTVYTSDGSRQAFGTNGDNSIQRSNILVTRAKAIDNLLSEPVNVENEAVQQYMSYGPYPGFGSTSYFTTYRNVLSESFCAGKDRPSTKTVSWIGAAQTYYVTFTDESAGSVVFQGRPVNATGFEFENMVPGHTYSYLVSDGNASVASGRFETAGQVRMVNIDDSWNYRDLGGWTGLDGKKVKYGHIYRGGSLNGVWQGSGYSGSDIEKPSRYVLSAKAIQQIEDLGIKAELDLRGITGEGEWGNQSDIHSRSLTVNGAAASNLLAAIPDLDFKQVMTDRSLMFTSGTLSERYAIVEDVLFIIDEVLSGKPVAFHCKSGADRTGAVSMLVLALLGVQPGDIARDYELTTLSHEKLVTAGALSFQTRTASEAWNSSSYRFFHNGFAAGGQDNWQQKAYDFLANPPAGVNGIPEQKLNEFINFMLE